MISLKIDNQNHDNIPAEYKLYLYWFQKYISGTKIDLEDYQSAELTTSLIDEFNAYLSEWEKVYEDNKALLNKPVDWDVQRKKTEYFKEKLKIGTQFEAYVTEEFAKSGIELGMLYDNNQFKGENKLGVEIKNDERYRGSEKTPGTGNLYIECYERLTNAQKWVRSGILKEDNTKVILIGTYNDYFIVLKEVLVDIYKKLDSGVNIEGCRLVEEKEQGTSKGFVINEKKMKRLCLTTSVEAFVNGYVYRNSEGTPLIIDTVQIVENAAYKYFHNPNKDCKYTRNMVHKNKISLSKAIIDDYCACRQCFGRDSADWANLLIKHGFKKDKR